MALAVGVRFKSGPKVYYFDPGDLKVRRGDMVVAETSRGPEIGQVIVSARQLPEEELVAPLKRLLRLADDEDRQRLAENAVREEEARAICQERINARGLGMKLVDVAYAFDGSKVTFYFTADGRVDFRELVKDVAAALRTRIQFHQIGARDAARLYDGLGSCGQQFCCVRFLSTFEPVAMKMAKEQSLFLNPTKFSGVCGKLMCCLRFEYDMYACQADRSEDAQGGRSKDDLVQDDACCDEDG